MHACAKAAAFLTFTCTLLAGETSFAQAALDRTVLPIPQPVIAPITEPDWRKAEMPPFFQVTAPDGAPNVLLVLIDDMGFGMPDAFGGPLQMDTLDQLAQEGLRYNRFHTAAVCSATRAALLTGHNAHAANSGEIADVATGFPGNTFVRPDRITPLAEILRQNGYSTAAFGKSHETPGWETSAMGPFDRWPTGSGFEKFYGFVGGETNQWAPMVIDGTTRIEVERGPGYHFTEDMTDKALLWLNTHHSLTPQKPFFLYFAPGGTHAPHHVPKEWADRFKGQFDIGWDRLREQTFARQKEAGVIPKDAKLSPRPPEIPAWDSFSPEEHALFARQMEVFAGYAAYTDHEVGRLVDQLREIGELDNTVVIYIAGDNGASAEGGPVGTYNEIAALNGVPGTTEQMMQYMDKWGGPETYPHFAMGWAWAGTTPFPWVKQIAGHLGGSRTGMVVRWPALIHDPGAIRSQFEHVIDVAPTVLELAGIPQPATVNGVVQRPMDGVSMVPSFSDSGAPENRTTQYFDVFGNRGIYHDGWLAATVHNVPWLFRQKLPAFEDDTWELYNLETDFSQAINVAAEYPEKLRELLAIFDKEAIRNQVYPIDDRKSERAVPALAGRPDLVRGRTEMTFYDGMFGLPELSIISIKGANYTVTADIEVKDAASHGVVFAQGGRFAGWTIYLDAGKPTYEYNYFGLERTRMQADDPISAGRHRLTLSFTSDDLKTLGAGGTAVLSVDGVEVASVRIPKTVVGVFDFDDGASVGRDADTPVSDDYAEGDNRFTGKVASVTIRTE